MDFNHSGFLYLYGYANHLKCALAVLEGLTFIKVGRKLHRYSVFV